LIGRQYVDDGGDGRSCLKRDEIEAKLIDLVDACSRVPLQFVMVTFASPDAGAEDVPQGCARAAHRGMTW
jgi:hypothetical protein